MTEAKSGSARNLSSQSRSAGDASRSKRGRSIIANCRTKGRTAMSARRGRSPNSHGPGRSPPSIAIAAARVSSGSLSGWRAAYLVRSSACLNGPSKRRISAHPASGMSRQPSGSDRSSAQSMMSRLSGTIPCPVCRSGTVPSGDTARNSAGLARSTISRSSTGTPETCSASRARIA